MTAVLGREVWRNAGSPEVDKDRLGVAIGTGLGGGDALIDSVDKLKAAATAGFPAGCSDGHAERSVAVVGLEHEARAGVITPVSACSSGSEAIANAWRMIVMGDADIMITGGVRGHIDAVPILAFTMMRAMSTRQPIEGCRDPSTGRDGFVFGEQTRWSSRPKACLGSRCLIHARIMGAGITSDGFHLVAPDPTGRGAARAMTQTQSRLTV